MQRNPVSRTPVRCGILLGLCLVLAATWFTPGLAARGSEDEAVFSELYIFDSFSEGINPRGGVVRDARGNFFGTASNGGSTSNACGQVQCGVVFEVSHGNETVLHQFSFTDGAAPRGTLVRDSEGNLYGTTSYGGTCTARGPYGCGVAFKVSSDGTETVLHDFTGATDGDSPSGLFIDGAGNLYGTTYDGGSYGNGSVFKIDPAGDYVVLYSFTGGTDGGGPQAGVIGDPSGNLYGTTAYGGGPNQCQPFVPGCGTIYKLSPNGTESVLFAFPGSNGSSPNSALAADHAGNLYGTTAGGGSSGLGELFKVGTSGNLTVLYGADFDTTSGAPPVIDADGNVYDTDSSSNANPEGEVFEVSPDGQVTVLHAFTGGLDGSVPMSSAIIDSAGNLYGTAAQGGSSACNGGCGAVFEIGHPVNSSSCPAQ